MEHVAVLPKMNRARAVRETASKASKADKRMTAEAAVQLIHRGAAGRGAGPQPLIHAHRADMLGNVQVDGYRHMDVDMARAARTVIVSAEQIVSPDEIAERPDRTMLPHFAVDAVVAAPHGAYPHECYGRYGPDLRHFDAYATAGKQDGPAAGLRYVEENADKSFASFLETAGPDRLAALAADAGELTPR